MKKELIIGVNNKRLTIALMEDDVLVELHRDDLERKYSVGDIYLGKVRKVLPALNAASTFSISLTSERAPVGQTLTHCPQRRHGDSANERLPAGATMVANPRFSNPKTERP